jgi:hypothetical protein
MAEENATNQVANQTGDGTQAAQAAQSVEQDTVSRADYEKLLAESRKWEARSKANAEAAKRLAELEDASKTDAEKLADATKRAEEAEAKVADYERRAERAGIVAEVAAKKGVDAEWLGRMAGDTAEEIQANADFLASKLSGAPIYPSVTDNGQKKTPDKKSAQDQFGDWFATVSNR